MRLLLLILLVFPSAFALNILMYVLVPGKSHVQFAEKIVPILTKHGHSVDMIFGMLNSNIVVHEDKFKMLGARQVVPVHFAGGSPWGKALHLTDPFEELTDWHRMTKRLSDLVPYCELLCDFIIASPEVADLLTSNKYDVAMINSYDLCPFALAHQYKISPVVSYVPTPIFNAQYYYAGLPELPLYESITFEASLADRSSFYYRIYETLRVFKERFFHHGSHTAVTGKFRARFGADFPDVREIARNTSLDFSNSHPLLEEPRPISLRVRYIGGVGLVAPKKLSETLEDTLNQEKKGNVIFSLGTQVASETINSHMQSIFVNTFKRFPEYNFLWKFDGKTATNASNVFNMEWLPQTDLLHDSRVVAFISHMGLNSFTETAFAGVPVVAIPLFADQQHNAKRAKALGMGEIVRKTEVTEENLSAALEKVLFDDRYRKRAKEISSMIAAMPDTPERIFIEGVEYAAKFKSLPVHYRLAGANHHFLVQLGWDVAAFFTLIMTLLVYFSFKLITFVLRRIPLRLRPKSKAEYRQILLKEGEPKSNST